MAKQTYGVELKRADAAALIDRLRLALAKELDEERETPFTEELEKIFKAASVPLPKTCTGQAHDPAVGGQIDNCGVCLHGLEWGWSGRPSKVR